MSDPDDVTTSSDDRDEGEPADRPAVGLTQSPSVERLVMIDEFWLAP